LRNWFAQQAINIDAEFASTTGFSDLPNNAEFSNTAASVFGLIDGVLMSYSIVADDIISGEIINNGLGVDAFLNQNTVIIENGRVTFVLTDPATTTRSVTRSPGTNRPSKPTALRAIGTASNEIVLVWDPSSDDVAVVGYRVLRDDSIIATTPYPVYVDRELPANQTHQAAR